MTEIEVSVECTCPKCKHQFTEETTVDVEPMFTHNEGYD